MTTPFYAGQKLTAAALNAVIPVSLIATAPGTLINSTSAMAVAGLAWPVVPGTYLVHAVIFMTANQSAGGLELQIGGPSASASGFTFLYYEGTSTWSPPVVGVNSPANPELTMSSGIVYKCVIDGTVTFTAAGTLAIEGACATSTSDTFTVDANSLLTITGPWT